MRSLTWTFLLVLLLSGCDSAPDLTRFEAAERPDANPAHEWRGYLGGGSHSHYSALDQINRSNVVQLQEAWRYHAGGEVGHGQRELHHRTTRLWGLRRSRIPSTPTGDSDSRS